MSTMSIRIPDSFHERLRALARRERVSINQLVATALGEKLSALDTEEYLAERARKGSRVRFRRALKHVPNVAPEPRDRR